MAIKRKPQPEVTFDGFHEALSRNLDRVMTDEAYREEITSEQIGNPITLGPRVVSAQSWVDDMTTAAAAKASKWKANSIRPRKDPKDKARKAATKYKNNMQASLDEDRWVAGINAYDENVRAQTIEAVGEEGYRRGITTKKAKAQHKIEKLQPLVAALTDTLDNMPVDTADQRAAKMIAARDGMLEIKKRLRTV